MAADMNEPCLVGDGFVQVIDGTFYMWYIYGTKWKKFEQNKDPCRIYKIAQATSKDGINWSRDGKTIIPDVFEDECQALPSVVKIDSRYHMVFSYRRAFDFHTNPENTYRLGYAYSDDLTNWTRDDGKLNIGRTEGSWDSDMMAYPNFFICNDRLYLLYNGNEFGKHGFGLAEGPKLSELK